MLPFLDTCILANKLPIMLASHKLFLIFIANEAATNIESPAPDVSIGLLLKGGRVSFS